MYLYIVVHIFFPSLLLFRAIFIFLRCINISFVIILVLGVCFAHNSHGIIQLGYGLFYICIGNKEEYRVHSAVIIRTVDSKWSRRDFSRKWYQNTPTWKTKALADRRHIYFSVCLCESWWEIGCDFIQIQIISVANVIGEILKMREFPVRFIEDSLRWTFARFWYSLCTRLSSDSNIFVPWHFMTSVSVYAVQCICVQHSNHKKCNKIWSWILSIASIVVPPNPTPLIMSTQWAMCTFGWPKIVISFFGVAYL